MITVELVMVNTLSFLPVSHVSLYIAYQRACSGHYDSAIEAHYDWPLATPLTESMAELRTDSNQPEDHFQPEGVPRQITAVG